MVPYPGAPDTLPELFAAYARGADDIAAWTKGMTPQQLRARPVAGKWSTHEVVCHVADSDEVLCDRIKRTIAMDKPLLIGFDETRYAAQLAYDQRDAAEEIALVRAGRAPIVRILRALPSDAWQRQCVHSERGLCTLKDLVQTAVGHVIHHGRFVAEKRKALGVG